MASAAAEAGLKSFLAESTLAYAEGDYQEKEVGKNLFVGKYQSGVYGVVDTYRRSGDKRVYSGREEVSRRRIPRWSATYHGSFSKDHEPEEALDAYAEALKSPTAELPIRGPRNVKINGFEYSLDSTHGPLSIARFAVIEQMTKDGARIYRGDIAGGWL